MNARFQADPNLIRQRRCASETYLLGTIKRMTTMLAYNIMRTINLIGAATLRASLA